MRKQATIVMLYGPKPFALSTVILRCQEQIAQVAGKHFIPYDLRQIHATLIGLEGVQNSNLQNLYFSVYRNAQCAMDIMGFIEFLQQCKVIPFKIQIGGFGETDIPFTSQARKPYERSFSITGNEPAMALMVGWPYCSAASRQSEEKASITQEAVYPSILNNIRLSAQQFGILHKYHRRTDDRDNDFYFRLGLLHGMQKNFPVIMELEHTIGRTLSRMKPIMVEINLSNIFLVSFQNETLPFASTQVWPLDTVKMTPAFIRSLYE
jgi:hypothetical protein